MQQPIEEARCPGPTDANPLMFSLGRDIRPNQTPVGDPGNCFVYLYPGLDASFSPQHP